MSIVSISEAARLANKSRKAVYKHIQQGKLSTVTTVYGLKDIDTSELIRVYGILSIQKETPVTINNQRFIDLEREFALSKLKIEQQEKELSYKQQIIDIKDIALSSKQETINSLKTALKLLEYHKDNSGIKTNSRKRKQRIRASKKRYFC